MKERNITKDEIEKILYKKVHRLKLDSEKNKNVKILLGCVNEKYIALLIESNKLITVRGMKNKEKLAFLKKQNEVIK
jgi:hypothetical protein